MKATPKAVVLGSLNVDFTYRVPRIPGNGETVQSRGMCESHGGKGANQAVAAHRAGAMVAMIGCVGDDAEGHAYLEALHAEGIGTDGVSTSSDLPTGRAVIFVEPEGENTIVVEAGANGAVTPASVDEAAGLIREADVLLVQLECPLEAVRRVCEIARLCETTVVLNPSPWDERLSESMPPHDYLIVNETEAAHFFGSPVADLRSLKDNVECGAVIVTRGSRSTLAAGRNFEAMESEPPSVSPVDTVGAGDSFAGALAVAIAEGRPLKEALVFANAAGALATLQPGAQAAIPRRAEIEEFLKHEKLTE